MSELLAGNPQRRSDALEAFLGLKESARGNPPDGPWRTVGRILAERLSGALDASLRTLFADAGGPSLPVALVAVGGYGRGELCLESDVDLLIVYAGDVPADFAQRMLYPLWDAKLSVGHAVRDRRDIARSARESVETLTAMMAGRLVAGDPELWDRAAQVLSGVVKKDRARLVAHLQRDEADVRAAEPYHRLDPDIKAGRGGLRTAQRIAWLHEITGSAPVLGAEATQGSATLLSARNGIHAWAGRAGDHLHADALSGAATWLGIDEADLGTGVLVAVRTLEAEYDRFYRSERRLRLKGRPKGQKSEAGSRLSPLAAAVEGQRSLTAEAIETMATSTGPWTESDRRTLVAWASSGSHGRNLADQLWDAGWLEREIPELAQTVGLVDLAPFHTHPVDTHLWRTVDELLALTGADSDEPWCVDLAESLGAMDELVIACLFHDIGKGRGGDHSQAGARLAAEFLDRTGWSAAATRMIARAIELHLLLPQVATRRDVRDPSVVAEVAAQIGDPQLVRALALLTAADSRATGPSTWGPWKSTLVRSLTRATLAALDGERGEAPAAAAITDRLADRFGPEAVARHVQRMGPGYLGRFDQAEVERHMELVTPVLESNEQRVLAFDDGALTTCMVAAIDQPGFLVAVAGVMAMHAIEVLDARLWTSGEGVVVDTFHVEDASAGGCVPEDRWERVRSALAQVLAGTLDLETQLAQRRHSYRHRYTTDIEPVVRIGMDGSAPTIEVVAADRIGLLHDIARVIFDTGHDIGLAKIDTRGGIATDVFHLENDADPASLDWTASALRAMLET